MAHKLSLADVVNVLQKFMTFHLHRFHSSVLSVHTSGRKRQYLPRYRTHLKKKEKKRQHQDLLFLITSVQKKILCALHADLLSSDTNYPLPVTLAKISLVLPPLSLPSLEATDCKGHFNSFGCIYVTAKNREYLSSVRMKSGAYCACLENWVPSAY